jgi:3-isopropylmalate dehydrogenase
VERAVDAVLEDPTSRTRDVGGSLNTDAFTAAVVDAVNRT